MHFLKDKDIIALILLFLFISASLSFFCFLLQFDEMPIEGELSGMMQGNVMAFVALMCAQVFFYPSFLIAIGIAKVFPVIHPFASTPIIGGIFASLLYIGFLRFRIWYLARGKRS